jgi:uncharacterized protein YkwD
MKPYLFSVLPFLAFVLLLQHTEPKLSPSPLAGYSSEWNDDKYLKCNTAANASYMSDQEKEVIYILNLLRVNPTLFANTVVQKYPDDNHQGFLRNIREYKSLLDTLRKTKPLPLLYPDSLCFVSAQCHAVSSGQAGYVGHERQTKECKSKYRFFGECCDYGHKEPLPILLSLLIDQNVPSLGHRNMCIGPYKKIGVSIQPHKGYGNTAVLDFYF